MLVVKFEWVAKEGNQKRSLVRQMDAVPRVDDLVEFEDASYRVDTVWWTLTDPEGNPCRPYATVRLK